MNLTIDWGAKIRSLIDMGSESYERKTMRVVLKAGAILLFLIVVYVFLIRRK